jgi:P4 family phage/plasmid primase-like protien
MGFETDFSKIGESMLDASVPAEALDYLLSRGHPRKGIAAAGFRYINGEKVKAMFPVASIRGTYNYDTGASVPDQKTKACWWPRYAIVLPYPGDPHYAVMRVEYKIEALGKETKGPHKYLTTANQGLKVYVPPMVSRKDLLNTKKTLYVVESPFKAVAAASHGIACVGVNGCHGAQEPQTVLPTDATADQARAVIRADLHDFLMKDREVCFLPDADVRSNLNVRRDLLTFLDAVAIGFDCKSVYVPLPDLGNGKSGIDDYFAAGHKLKNFEKLPRESRDSENVKTLQSAFFEQTEIGLARRFEVQHGRDCRHDPNAAEWYTWTPGGYRAGPVEPESRIIQTIGTLAAETDAAKSPEDKAVRAKFAKDSARLNAQNAALTIAGRFPSMAIDAAQFDTDSNLLGVRNGILNLSAGKLLEPSRESMVTKSTACAFDSKATAPLFTQFIDTATDGVEDLKRHIQEILGASLLGRAMRTQLHIIYGPTSTGKSVLIEIALALHGDYGMASKADLLLRQRRNTDPEKPSPFLKTLRGRRLVVCSELNEGVAFDDALIKDLTGGDTVTARGLNEAPITFRNTATIWVRGNHLPTIGAEAAMRERVIVTPLTHVIDAAHKDKTLAERIIAAELPGVLNWALIGMRRYVKRGYEFDLPAAVVKATAQMQRDSDVTGLWLNECVKIDMTQTEPPYREEAKAFVESYRIWCMQNGHTSKSSKSLYTYMRRRYSLDEDWPLKSNGKVFATGCQVIRDGAAADIVEQYTENMRALAKQLADANREIAALKSGGRPAAASGASDASSSPRVVDIASRRKQ